MKKAAKTKKSTPYLIGRKQWMVIALLVVVLVTFGFVVYIADALWIQTRSF